MNDSFGKYDRTTKFYKSLKLNNFLRVKAHLAKVAYLSIVFALFDEEIVLVNVLLKLTLQKS